VPGYASNVAELRFFWDYMNEQADRIRRAVSALNDLGAEFALIGGHAVSYHIRPRVTVDVDFLVGIRDLDRVAAALEKQGFRAEKRGEILRAWEKGADTQSSEPVLDIVPAYLNQTSHEALRGAVTASYEGTSVRIVSRSGLAALKFLAATSAHRAQEDRLQDAADLARLMKGAWTEQETAEARRLVALTRAGADAELQRFIDDVRAGRPLTI
jgi:Nucleotidyl transferase AbiEii toxin, Type IV TA system